MGHKYETIAFNMNEQTGPNESAPYCSLNEWEVWKMKVKTEWSSVSAMNAASAFADAVFDVLVAKTTDNGADPGMPASIEIDVWDIPLFKKMLRDRVTSYEAILDERYSTRKERDERIRAEKREASALETLAKLQGISVEQLKAVLATAKENS
jgi:hypothetical protein